jgi:hypothetical protein
LAYFGKENMMSALSLCPIKQTKLLGSALAYMLHKLILQSSKSEKKPHVPPERIPPSTTQANPIFPVPAHRTFTNSAWPRSVQREFCLY